MIPTQGGYSQFSDLKSKIIDPPKIIAYSLNAS